MFVSNASQSCHLIDIPSIYNVNLTPAELSAGCLNKRFVRNIAHATIAGGLSAAGACLPGFMPVTWAKIAGGVIAGVGNIASTVLPWTKKNESVIELRLTKDLPRINLKVDEQEAKLVQLIEKIQSLYLQNASSISSSIFDANKTSSEVAVFKRKNQGHRLFTNLWRLTLAGSLSALGGYIGSYYGPPNIPGVLVGAALSGLGNGLSTWLYFDQKNSAFIKHAALNRLPEMTKILEDNEQKLIELINKVKLLHPQCIINDVDHLSQNKPFATVESTEIKKTCYLKTRNQRNFLNVNVAGWSSAIGGCLSAFTPSNKSIYTHLGYSAGALITGAANMISTRLEWEKPTDAKVEKIAVDDLPKIALRIENIREKLKGLNFLFTTN